MTILEIRTSSICDGAYLVVEAYSFIRKWIQSQMFSKIFATNEQLHKTVACLGGFY